MLFFMYCYYFILLQYFSVAVVSVLPMSLHFSIHDEPVGRFELWIDVSGPGNEIN